ncbi:hypothetical protein GY45DRAFT_950380 [Cubamyces sp. BRFM 1775]|nr:hypothetical protein GY45DRAFT_950380 [Cubamyces sp. BRFM 1775]
MSCPVRSSHTLERSQPYFLSPYGITNLFAIESIICLFAAMSGNTALQYKRTVIITVLGAMRLCPYQQPPQDQFGSKSRNATQTRAGMQASRRSSIRPLDLGCRMRRLNGAFR